MTTSTTTTARLTEEEKKAIAEVMREMLLKVPRDDREGVLANMDVCLHCGTDERPRSHPCQCWNDE